MEIVCHKITRTRINTGFDKGSVSLSLWKCNHVPFKKGKSRDKCQESVSIAESVCKNIKLASAAIANRIKPHLDKTIGNIQNGFDPGSYISDCARTVYDVMQITEARHIPGMLVLLDFKKAFILFCFPKGD